MQKHPLDGQQVIVNGCDPLNLVGTTLAGDRLPAVASTNILFEDGIAVAASVAGSYSAWWRVMRKLSSASVRP